jgi:hypothetical protein
VPPDSKTIKTWPFSMADRTHAATLQNNKDVALLNGRPRPHACLKADVAKIASWLQCFQNLSDGPQHNPDPLYPASPPQSWASHCGRRVANVYLSSHRCPSRKPFQNSTRCSSERGCNATKPASQAPNTPPKIKRITGCQDPGYGRRCFIFDYALRLFSL